MIFVHEFEVRVKSGGGNFVGRDLDRGEQLLPLILSACQTTEPLQISAEKPSLGAHPTDSPHGSTGSTAVALRRVGLAAAAGLAAGGVATDDAVWADEPDSVHFSGLLRSECPVGAWIAHEILHALGHDTPLINVDVSDQYSI
jgi:hypothetical protein